MPATGVRTSATAMPATTASASIAMMVSE
jgi:hypothetical protein